jgi:hypothetical protein
MPLHYPRFGLGAISMPDLRTLGVRDAVGKRKKSYHFFVCFLDVLLRGILTDAK